MADGRGPRIDLHSHAGRCFLPGLPAGHALVAALGAPAVPDAVRAARAAGITALVLSAVADFAVLRPDSATGGNAVAYLMYWMPQICWFVASRATTSGVGSS